MDIFKLIGSIFVKNDDANSKISDTASKSKSMAETVGSAMKTAGEKISSVGKALTPVSVACGTLLTASVKGASDFSDGMAKMSTLFDTSKTSVSDLSKEFLDLSNKTGISATELAEAGYQALSAGQSVDQVGSFVQTAGNLAKAGFTSTSTAVDVLTTAINAYGDEAGTADQISNKLVKTQNLGKTTVDELASSMGKIIPTASNMGVGIDQLCSGYVTLTKQGIATAESTTYMNSMLNELGDSSTSAGMALEAETGKSFQDLMADGYSLADCLQIVKDHGEKSGKTFNQMFGSAEGAKAGMAILNQGVEEFNNTVETMSTDTDEVGEALDKLNTPSVKIKKSLNQIKNSGIELGTAFMTSLSPTIDKVSSAIQKATEWFNSLSSGTKTTIATILVIGTALAPVIIVIGKVVSAIGTFITIIPKIKMAITGAKTAFTAFSAVLSANPIILVVVAITALVAGFIYLWNNCEGFRNFWIGLWNTIKTTVSNVVTAVVTFFTNLWTNITTIFTTIVTTVQTAWNTICNAVRVAITLIGNIISLAVQIITIPWRFVWENCKTYLISAWNAIKSVVRKGINAVKTVISTILNAIKTVFSTVWNAIKTVITTVMTAIKTKVSSVWNAIKNAISKVLSTIKTAVSTAWNGIKTTVSTVMNGIKTAISTAWNAVKTTVSGAINGVKSTIGSGLNGALTTVKNVLGKIKGKFSSIMDDAKSAVSGAIDSIKEKFNFSWSLPKLKLPHLSITGKFSINPPSVPSFGIEWYKKAMEDPYMFTSPTVFGMNPVTGQMKGAGEAGDEMIYGHDSLMNDISEASGSTELISLVKELISTIKDQTNQIYEVVYQIMKESGQTIDERDLRRLVKKYA